MTSASGKALIAQLLAKHAEVCERDLALCNALLNGGTGKAKHKAKAIVASANAMKKAGKGTGNGQKYGPHNPHWTQTPKGRKLQRERMKARMKAKHGE